MVTGVTTLFNRLESMKVDSGQKVLVVVGQGYVGLPLSMAAVKSGYKVHGVEIDERKHALLRAGNSYVEDVPDEELRSALVSGDYLPTLRLDEGSSFDFAVITVPTPLSGGNPDLTCIEEAGKSLAARINPGCTVILESTTYPGTTEEFLIPQLEKTSSLKAGLDFFVGYSPERIDPGNEVWNLKNTPKVVSGIDGQSLSKVSGFYESLGIEVVRVKGTREAELAKLLENTFRHVNIALVNELAVFAQALRVDIWDAIAAASTKPFGFMKFLPGPGVGGHCLPIDPSYLSWAVKEKTGSNFKFVDLANQVNESMPGYVVRRLRTISSDKELAGKRVLIVGIAYKANTGDVRQSPSLEVLAELRTAGATVSAIDNYVDDYMWPDGLHRIRRVEDAECDLAVILVAHDNIDTRQLLALKIPVLDTRKSLISEGVTYL